MTDTFAFYGILMDRGKDYGPLADLGTYGQLCRIRGDLYDMGAFPALIHGDGVVHGQLWTPHPGLEARAYEEIDRIEGYDGNRETSMYLRQRVGLIEPQVEAWTYVWNQDLRYARLIPGGYWPERFTQSPRLPDYTAGATPIVHLPAVISGEFGIPRSAARRAIALGEVKVNGEVVTDLDIDLASIESDLVSFELGGAHPRDAIVRMLEARSEDKK